MPLAMTHCLVEYGYSAGQPLSIARSLRRLPGFLWTVLGAALLLAHPGQAQTVSRLPLIAQAKAKFSRDLLPSLTRNSGAERIPVIVQTQGGRRPLLLSSAYAKSQKASPMPCRLLDATGVYAASVTQDELALLASDSAVLRISPDRPLRACQDFAAQTVGAPTAWDRFGVTGSGVTVAVLDTGVYSHSDLTSHGNRLVGWKDFVNGKAAPYDDNGHGTHVTGIVAGSGAAAMKGDYNRSFTWMAPEVTIVGVKVLDKTGSGSVSTVIAGINWCIDHRQQYHIRILNLSLGHPIAESFQTDPLCQACERAWKSGILVVCAAGNGGRSVPDDPSSAPAYGTIVSPGNDPMVLTVGATNTQGTPTITDDAIASYSSRGPSAMDFVLKPDIVAPGNRIESLAAPDSSLFVNYPGNQVDPAAYSGKGRVQYFQLSGTSMACPVVAGAAALLLEDDGSLTPDTLKARLMVSAKKSAAKDPFSYGAGCLNVPAALACRVKAPQGAYSPQTYPAGDGTICIIPKVTTNNLIWGANLIWGDNKTATKLIWGASDWNGGSISTDSVWNGQAATTGTTSDTSLLSVLLQGD